MTCEGHRVPGILKSTGNRDHGLGVAGTPDKTKQDPHPTPSTHPGQPRHGNATTRPSPTYWRQPDSHSFAYGRVRLGLFSADVEPG
jgi:hypothetical protein